MHGIGDGYLVTGENVMILSLNEFAKSMELPPSTIERWIRQGRIPVRRKGEMCVFSTATIRKWAASHNLIYTPPSAADIETQRENNDDSLVAVMKLGGVYHNIPGNSVESVLRAAVDRMEVFDDPAEKEILFQRLIEREQMMSTGIGNGIAVPHPRTPLPGGHIPPLISTCFLEKPVEYHAVDKQPVFALLVLVAPTAKLHLHILSRISFCLRDSSFIELLRQTPDAETLLAKVAQFDARFDLPGA